MDIASNSGSMSQSMTMAMSTATQTASAAASSGTAMSMSGMGGMGGGSECRISMLWNWYTIDSCFIARSWHVRSNGAFAGSCIGVVLLVVTLEALRRASREYDAYIIREKRNDSANFSPPLMSGDNDSGKNNTQTSVRTSRFSVRKPNTPTAVQQSVRALLHMLQFAVAYFVMLLAMYYNGYIIICIFIGAFIGAFIFSWHSLGGVTSGQDPEVTYCCG